MAFKKMSELLSEQDVKLAVNSTDSSSYSVLQYCGMGNLQYNENGVGFCDYSEHYDKLQTFMDLAKKQDAKGSDPCD